MAREKAPLPNAGPADDKKRAIDTAMAQIERMYGKGSIMRFGDKRRLLPLSHLRRSAFLLLFCACLRIPSAQVQVLFV